MLDYIIFAENMYPARKVAIEGYESELTISTEDLEDVLINEDGGFTSPEARLIDEQIFFYVPKRIAVDCSDARGKRGRLIMNAGDAKKDLRLQAGQYRDCQPHGCCEPCSSESGPAEKGVGMHPLCRAGPDPGGRRTD